MSSFLSQGLEKYICFQISLSCMLPGSSLMKAATQPCFFYHEVKKTTALLETLTMATDFCVICWNLLRVLTQLYLTDCELWWELALRIALITAQTFPSSRKPTLTCYSWYDPTPTFQKCPLFLFEVLEVFYSVASWSRKSVWSCVEMVCWTHYK